MATPTTELAEILSTAQRPGNFYSAGTIDIFTPRLEVVDVGPIALPLLPVQAQQLIAVAAQAPYGMGEATLVDTSVRRTWQIDPTQVQLSGRHWEQTLANIVEQATVGLGVSGEVVADFYKLLVYDTGSFFVSHRDTEKVPGMFATLILVLPSLYTGGALLVRHGDREVRLELRCAEPSEAAFAAFYADCVHEVLPITSGYRLALIYNLRRTGRGRVPAPPNYDTEQARMTALLQRWSAGKSAPDDTSPEKLIYPLEHAYTPAELAFAALKGADAAAATVFVPAAAAAACDLYLALLSIAESGSAEHTGYYSSRRSRWSDEEDDDAFEVGEVDERSATLSEWRSPDDSQPTLGKFPFEEDELCPPDAFVDMQPDEQHFHEATGNEGASFERTYRRAAFVLWPRTRRLAVFNQAGLDVTLPYLGDLTGRWADSGADPASPLWQEAHELSGHMLRTWPQRTGWYPQATTTPSHTTTMLTLLHRLQDTAHIDTFLTTLATTGYSQSDNQAIVQAAGLLSPERAAALLEGIMSGHAVTDLSACGDLLARSAAAQFAGHAADFRPAATALIKALPGDPAQTPQRDAWRQVPRVVPGFLVHLFTALQKIDGSLADQVAEHILAWPKIYEPDAVLVPAILELSGQEALRNLVALQRLRTAARNHLHTRSAEPLEPPRDWTRNSTLTCKCKHCSELSRFLAAPDLPSWTFKASEADRRHVEDTIRRSGSDLHLVTERRGRPYSLVCTKNQASYERRAQQRQQDLAHLARLEVS